MQGVGLGAPSRRRVGRAQLGALLLIAVFAASSMTWGQAPPASFASAAAPSAASPTASSPAGASNQSSASAAGSLLPGSVPSGQVFSANLPVRPVSPAQLAALGASTSSKSTAPTGQPGDLRSPSANAADRTAAAAAPAPATACSYAYPYGCVAGWVRNASFPYAALSGVSVVWTNLGISNCDPSQGGPSSGCMGTSNANGYFDIPCYLGQGEVTATYSGFATNGTFLNCVTAQTTFITPVLGPYASTMAMTQDGWVTGYVYSAPPHSAAISGVTVVGSPSGLGGGSGCSQGSPLANPEVTTGGNGYFKVPVPGGEPAEVDFEPPANTNFQTNCTWVEVAPGGTTPLSVFFDSTHSILYLQAFAAVKATLYDAITDEPVAEDSSITVCSLITSVCGPPGPTSGDSVEAVGPSGPDYVIAQSVEYIENNTPIGNVTGSGVFNAGKIFLVPIGAVEATTEVQWAKGESSSFSTGEFYLQDCGLLGYYTSVETITGNLSAVDCITSTDVGSGCGSVGSSLEVAAFPMRNEVVVTPDTGTVCNGLTPTWPIPTDLPVWSNWSYANVTPDEVTNVGFLNLTPGAYITGNVYVQGSRSAPNGGFEITATSQLACGAPGGGTICASYSYNNQIADQACSASENGPTFAVPAPPGDDELTISFASSNAPYAPNETWGYVSWTGTGADAAGKCIPLNDATIDHEQDINVTGNAIVLGSAVSGKVEVPYPSVQACPASSLSTASCVTAISTATGTYNVTGAPLGWDVVKIDASGYAPNSEWINVTGDGVLHIPAVSLTPEALLEGQVVAPNGTAVPDATMSYCALSSASTIGSSCSTVLGTGATTTDGYYEGYVTGGWLPWATYEVEASLAGFQTTWTWVNATENGTVTVPTLILAPFGESAGPLVHGASVRARPAGAVGGGGATWISGRLVNSEDGAPVATYSITACATTSSSCYTAFTGTNTGGFFNGTVPAGITYNLTFVAVGYLTTTVILVTLNATGSVAMGTVDMQPLDMVQGYLALSPWERLHVENPDADDRLTWIRVAPPALVWVCNSASWCDATGLPDATSGLFVIPTIGGTALTIDAVSSGNQGGSIPISFANPLGFNPNETVFNTTGVYTVLPNPTMQLDLFALLTGQAFLEPAGPTGIPTPAPWTTVNVVATGPNDTALNTISRTDGRWWAIVGDNNPVGDTRLSVGTATYTWPAVYVIPVPIGTQTMHGHRATLDYVAPPLNATQFGWVTARVYDAATHQPISDISITAAYQNLALNESETTNGVTNLGGYVNISAPTANGVLVTIGTGVTNSVNFTVNITPDHTTPVNHGETVLFDLWGWVSSEYTTYAAPSGYLGTIRDAANGQAIPYAEAVVTSANSTSTSSPTESTASNWLGEFLSIAATNSTLNVTVSLAGYASNQTQVKSLYPGENRPILEINLTGDAVIAGQVLSLPGDVPVANALVTACPDTPVIAIASQCNEMETNLTGVYWITMPVAPTGLVNITVSATNYAPAPTVTVPVTSDHWSWAGTYLMAAYGGAWGTIRGYPTGEALTQASVSLYPYTPGIPAPGSALQTLAVLSNASFFLYAPPGQYVLGFSAPGFNSSYLSVTFVGALLLPLGSQFLEGYGALLGAVNDASTGAPIVGATIEGCLAYGPASICAPTTLSQSGGAYTIAVPPGWVELTVSAPGYETGYARYLVGSGGSVIGATISLVPIGVQVTVELSGYVLTKSGGSLSGVPDALVALVVGNATAYSTVTNGAGAFAIEAYTGPYRLVASAAGFVSQGEPINLTSATSVELVLSVQTYALTGTVTDGLSGAGLVGAQLYADDTEVGESGSGGAFALALANGTYTLEAEASSSIYLTASRSVQVSGHAISRIAFALYPFGATYAGQVIDRGTGVALVGASVTLAGTASDGWPLWMNTTTDAAGGFTFASYAGTYRLTVTAPGYYSSNATVNTTGGSAPYATFEMTAVPGPASATSALSGWIVPLVALGLVAAVVVGITLMTRAQRSKGENR